MIGASTGMIVGIYAALLLFGVAYNLLVAWLEKKGYLHGFTALAVVVGVLATLGGVALISWQFALISLGAFCASGAPMLIGSILRYVKEREAAIRKMREDLR